MRFLVVIAILLCIDFYVYQGVRVLLSGSSPVTQRITFSLFWLVTAVAVTTIVVGHFIPWHDWPRMFRTYLFAFIVIVYLSKIFVSVFLLLDDIIRGLRWLAQYVKGATNTDAAAAGNGSKGITRLDFLVKAGFVVGSIPFFSMIYGMIKGPDRFMVRRKSLASGRLPQAFNGFRIVQISDLHLGSFFSKEPISRAIRMIAEQKPDLILFTGDLVNDVHDEALPYDALLRQLKAPYGVYSVLGNHDYGDYYRWESEEKKRENLVLLKKFQRDLGWKLLLNEHAMLEKNGARIGLIGVENWSSRMSFQRYGDMKHATENMEPLPFNILMSHDPSHWQAEILPEYPQVDLMLSGHTHGMQFGVEIPGFKWSPVQYVYKEWADLYTSGHQKLYVNRGLGFIGYPGRVGIMPEITVIDLVRA